MRTIAFAIILVILPFTAFSADWQITTLENGLDVMILEYHQVPQVNISTTISVGAKNETSFFDGATHLLEHLILYRGTENMTGGEVGMAMSKHGAYFNGYTSSDWTDFVISLPSENLEFALQIHADMLFRSNFSEEEMNKERQAIVEEINIRLDNPRRSAYWTMFKKLFEGHAYERNILGPKENILNIPRDSVYAYYKRYYAPNNMTMVIVGDIDAGYTLELVKRYFADFPPGEKTTDLVGRIKKRKEVSRIILKRDITQAYLMMSMVGAPSDSPDQYALNLIATMLGNGKSSRLWKTLRDELGIVYSCTFNFSTYKYEGPIYAYAVLEPDKIGSTEEAIKQILIDVKTSGFTEQELRKAKNTIKTNYYTGHERGLDIADSYAQYDSFIGYEFIQNYPDNVEKVTLADIQAAAQKYLNTDSYVLTTVVPK
ncbi:MAG: insulinase family protein [Candidatus Zixiibacteriota bacterium]|nr:MAG: insulinase family protein [candidate division Zixibacteria bacterium]